MLLGHGKDCKIQCHDIATEWYIGIMPVHYWARFVSGDQSPAESNPKNITTLALLSFFLTYHNQLALCQDSATEWNIRSWCWQLGPLLPVGQHYKVTMNVTYDKSIPVLI